MGQLLDGIFCSYLLNPFDLVSFNSDVSFIFSFLFFGLDDLSIGENGVLKSPTVIVLGSTYPFMSSNICFMKLGAPTFCAYIFTFVISS
jgi:hypothetical protein